MIFGRRRKRIRPRQTARSSFARHLLRGFLLFFVLALLCTLVHYTTRLAFLTIRDIDVSGGVTIPHDAVRDTAAAQLRGSYWRLVPHAFTLTYPHDAIIQALAAYPRMYDPRVERVGSTGLRITFEEYMPQALLCAAGGEHGCFLIDAHGRAFEEAGTLQGGALVRYIDEARPEIARGDTLPLDRLRTAERFIERTEQELGLRVGKVIYTEDGDIRFEMHGGGSFLVSGAHDLDGSFEDIRTVLEVDTYADLEAGDFRYIDARFPPKVFVNDTPPEVATSTEGSATTTDDAL